MILMYLETASCSLTPNENNLAEFYISMIKIVVNNWVETGAELTYYFDHYGSSLPMRFESLEEKNQFFQTKVDKFTARAREHYSTRTDTYYQQAVQEANAASVDVDFQGDVASFVRILNS